MIWYLVAAVAYALVLALILSLLTIAKRADEEVERQVREAKRFRRERDLDEETVATTRR